MAVNALYAADKRVLLKLIKTLRESIAEHAEQNKDNPLPEAGMPLAMASEAVAEAIRALR